MRRYYHTKHIKILVEKLKETTLIKIDDKYRTWFSSISENSIPSELEQDKKDALAYIPTRSARKWFKNICYLL